MKNGISRRNFIQNISALSMSAALGGCEFITQLIRNRPVRRDIATMSATDPNLIAYREAVRLMKALPPTDPRNWTRQAAIHQNFCPHGNWFFLPWHRAYLLSFERICQTLLNDKSFGLPYWNWSCNRAIPAPFWQSGSPLFHSPRTASASSMASANIVGPTAMESILSETDFELFASGFATDLRGGSTFYGAIEGGPHNYIHGFIGGTMGSFMSPLDPVFWCHHNVIDYFWYEWNQRGNANTNASSYVNFNIAGHMVDGNGNPITYEVGSLLLAPLLSYRYQPPLTCGPLRFHLTESVGLRRLLEQGSAIRFAPEREFPAISGVERFTLNPTTRLQIPISAQTVNTASASLDRERLLLRISDVRPPSGENFFVQVYLNLADNEPASISSPAYAGSFAFFSDSSMQSMTFNYLVDISNAIERLRSAGRLDQNRANLVTLVTIPVEQDRPINQTMSFGSLQPITIRRQPQAVPPQ